MAHITMCLNPTCPLADTCYRVQAEPSPYWQPKDGIKCDNYWPVWETIASERPEK